MIDLGQKNDYSSPAVAVSVEKEPKVSYPSLYFTCDKEYDIPDTGTATIKFRKVEDSENVRDPKDPKYRYELEIQGIEIDGMDEGDDDGDEEGEAMPDFKGAIKKAMTKKMEEE
jgi:hypothetical protein